MRARKSQISFPHSCPQALTFDHISTSKCACQDPARSRKTISQVCPERLNALEPEIGVEHADVAERVDRDVLEEVGEQITARALAEEPAAADEGLLGGKPRGVEAGVADRYRLPVRRPVPVSTMFDSNAWCSPPLPLSVVVKTTCAVP
jgi:hypothetical protein